MNTKLVVYLDYNYSQHRQWDWQVSYRTTFNVYVTGVQLLFFFVETYFMHWDHGIEDTDAPDVVCYYYLFNSLVVRTQYNQRGYVRGLKQTLKSERALKRGTLRKGLCNNNNNHKYKYQ